MLASLDRGRGGGLELAEQLVTLVHVDRAHIGASIPRCAPSSRWETAVARLNTARREAIQSTFATSAPKSRCASILGQRITQATDLLPPLVSGRQVILDHTTTLHGEQSMHGLKQVNPIDGCQESGFFEVPAHSVHINKDF